MSCCRRPMVAANSAVAAPMTATTALAVGDRAKMTLVRTTRYTPAVTIVAAWISADTGIGPPGIERDLRRLAGAPERDEQGDGGDDRAIGRQLGGTGGHLGEVERPKRVPGEEHRDEEPEISDAVHDECLLAGIRIGRLAIPVPDQQVGAEPHTFPADE